MAGLHTSIHPQCVVSTLKRLMWLCGIVVIVSLIDHKDMISLQIFCTYIYILLSILIMLYICIKILLIYIIHANQVNDDFFSSFFLLFCSLFFLPFFFKVSHDNHTEDG